MSNDCTACASTMIGVFRKRSRTIQVTLAGPGDLTDAKIWFSVKQDDADPDSEAVIAKASQTAGGSDTEAKVTNPYYKDTDEDSPTYGQMVGTFEIYLVPDDTADVEAGNYRYDIVIETAAGRRLEAVAPSRFEVWQPVTLT